MERGIAFPFGVAEENGSVKMSEEQENIRQSVRIILMTEPGERLTRPEFGTRLHRFLFEIADSQMEEMLAREVIRSLTAWEERIANIEVRIDRTEGYKGILRIGVAYQVLRDGRNDRVDILLE